MRLKLFVRFADLLKIWNKVGLNDCKKGFFVLKYA